jgi:hypothetical protein
LLTQSWHAEKTPASGLQKFCKAKGNRRLARSASNHERRCGRLVSQSIYRGWKKTDLTPAKSQLAARLATESCQAGKIVSFLEIARLLSSIYFVHEAEDARVGENALA